jgi:uncharacterized protein (DUF2384 family)
MTFKDESDSRRPQEERIDRLTTWLEMMLGTKLTAFAAGVAPSDICRFAHGDQQPGEEAEQRLRNLYAAAWIVAGRHGPRSAYDWLVQPYPELDDRAPVDLLRDGEPPRPAWFALSPAF